MNYILGPDEQSRIVNARESFSGRLLTDSQFDEAMMITGVIEGEIQRSGRFKEKLGDYAYAFARSDRYSDPVKAENTLRDLFKARTGQTMNQMREGLLEREAKLLGRDAQNNEGDPGQNSIQSKEPIEPEISEAGKARAIAATDDVAHMVETGDKMAFHRAYAHQAAALAKDFGITEFGAKRLMKDQFELHQNRPLQEWGKELDEKYYRPQIEAEIKERETAKDRAQSERPEPERQRMRS